MVYKLYLNKAVFFKAYIENYENIHCERISTVNLAHPSPDIFKPLPFFDKNP